MTTNNPTRPRGLRSNPLSRCILVSEHAVDRYIERIGTTGLRSRRDVVLRILDLLPEAIPVTDTKFYADGIVMTVIGSVVTTVYRPETRSQKLKVRKALARFRSETSRFSRSNRS